MKSLLEIFKLFVSEIIKQGTEHVTFTITTTTTNRFITLSKKKFLTHRPSIRYSKVKEFRMKSNSERYFLSLVSSCSGPELVHIGHHRMLRGKLVEDKEDMSRQPAFEGKLASDTED